MTESEEFYMAVAIWGSVIVLGCAFVWGLLLIALKNRSGLKIKMAFKELFKQNQRSNGQHKQ